MPEGPPRPVVVRVRGLPSDSSSAAATISQILQNGKQEEPHYKISVLPSCQRPNELAALVDFPNGLPECLVALRNDCEATHVVAVEDDDVLFDTHFVGFTQLSTTNEAIAADIITICGIDGHAYGSWKDKSTTTQRMWLRHFLPKDLSLSCRILTYGYSAKLARGDFSTLDDYSWEFLDALKRIRSGPAKDRPIIFIAHSFGGIVLAQALIKAKQGSSKGDDDLVSIYSSLAGILFFAVPHRGIDVEDMSRIMGAENHPRSGLLQHIKIDSEALRLQSEEFKDLLYGHKVVSFFETEQSRRLQRSSTGAWTRSGELFTSLPRDSAVLALPTQIETRIPVHKDHSSIIKFSSKYDVGYEQAIHHIEQFLHSSPAERKTIPTSDNFTHKAAKLEGDLTPFEIPFPRDENFVRRPKLMRLLRHNCTQPGSRTALVGLGGVGKSQLAVECAYQLWEEVPGTTVLWIHASNTERFEQGVSELIDRLNIDTPPDTDVLKLFQQWLHRRKRWLLILDNVDNDQFLHEHTTSNMDSDSDDSGPSPPLISYLPQTRNGSILFTTRSMRVAQNLVDSSNIIEVKVMSEGEAVELLGQKIRDQEARTNTQCLELVHELDCMPLAIIQAAAYVTQRSCSIGRYLELFRDSDKNRKSLLAYEAGKPRRDWDSSSAILITWQLSFESIRQKNQQAADLLSIFCLLDRQEIPEEIVRQTLTVARKVDSDHDENVSDIEFEHAILVLQEYSMVSVSGDTESFHMHRLVQLATRHWLAVNGTFEVWQGIVVKGLTKSCPVSHERFPECQRFYPHFISLQALQMESSTSLNEWSKLCVLIAWWRSQVGDLEHADTLTSWALTIEKSKQQINCIYLVNALVVRAQILERVARSTEALEILEEAYDLAVRFLDPDHEMIALIISTQANAFAGCDRFTEAESLARTAMERIEETYGPTHPNTLMMASNLGIILMHQKHYPEAEGYLRHALRGLSMELGEDSRDCINCKRNLALTCGALEKWDEVVELETTFLEMAEREFGKDHIFTMGSREFLIAAYVQLKQFGKLEPLERMQLDLKSRKFGPSDERTLLAMNNLARTLANLGRFAESIDMMQQALDRYTALLGPDHPDTKNCVETLAFLRRDYQRQILEGDKPGGKLNQISNNNESVPLDGRPLRT